MLKIIRYIQAYRLALVYWWRGYCHDWDDAKWYADQLINGWRKYK